MPAEAAALLYERYRDRVFGYCLYMLGNRDEAEDATQTAFLHAFRALRRGVVPAIEAAWLFKIAENVCLSTRRSAARRRRVETPGDLLFLQEVVPAPDHQADELIGLDEALADMPETQRRALLLREWQGLSYREIAERLRVSQAAVETLLFRARRSLAKNLTVPPATRHRVARVLDFGALVGAAKSAFAGASAVKVAATIAAVATATVVVGSTTALGESQPAEKESSKHVDVVSAPAGVNLGGTSLQRTERLAVVRGRPAPGKKPETTVAERPTTKAKKDDKKASEPTASDTSSGSGSAPAQPSGSPPPAPPASPPSIVPISPPSLEAPALPSTPEVPVQPPSLPVSPPSLPLNPPALPPAPLP